MRSAAETLLEAKLQAKPPVHLVVEDLEVTYHTNGSAVRAIDGVSFEVAPGSVLGLVGESGCGKSTIVKALLRLLPDSARIGGKVLLDSVDVLTMDADALRNVRWNKLALVTQSAMNALDPVIRIGDQIVESILVHESVGRDQAQRRAQSLFAMVGLPPERLAEFPHHFSGGMRQRAVIAMALSLNAGLLLADEPTTALDPIMQDQIMTRIRGLQRSLHRSMVLVTHDIGLVAENCDSVAVMYAGRIIEKGPVLEVLTAPRHPYTMGLRNAFPRMPEDDEARPVLISIPGGLPDLRSLPSGCRFSPRCPFATALCRSEDPELMPEGAHHSAACHYQSQAETFRQSARDPQTWRKEEMPL